VVQLSRTMTRIQFTQNGVFNFIVGVWTHWFCISVCKSKGRALVAILDSTNTNVLREPEVLRAEARQRWREKLPRWTERMTSDGSFFADEVARFEAHYRSIGELVPRRGLASDSDYVSQVLQHKVESETDEWFGALTDAVWCSRLFFGITGFA